MQIHQLQDLLKDFDKNVIYDQDLKKKSIEHSDEKKVNVSLLLTGAVGLSCEANEILEIVKKIIFR